MQPNASIIIGYVLVSISVDFLEVALAVLGVRNHRGLPWLPPSWADLSVLVSVLEGLHQPQSLVNVPPHRQVVHGDLPQLALTIDDEEPPEAKSLVLLEDPVGLADCHVLVSQERDVHLSQPTVLPLLLTPGQVGEVGVREQANTAQFRASNS